MSEEARRVGDFAVKYALHYGYIDADICHSVKIDGDKRVIGAVLKGLAKKGFIRPGGYKRSRRAKCHSRPIVHYQLAR